MSGLSIAYVVGKVYVFAVSSEAKVNSVCKHEVVLKIASRVIQFTYWASVISFMLTLFIMIYYLSRTGLHRYLPEAHTYEHRAYRNEVIMPFLVILAGTLVVALDIGTVAALLVPRLASYVEDVTFTNEDGESERCMSKSRLRHIEMAVIATALLYVLILAFGHYSGLEARKRERDDDPVHANYKQKISREQL